jgi:hypothetical protein
MIIDAKWRRAVAGAVLAALVAWPAAWAAELHVDPARGNDAAAGTDATPLRSIGAALERVVEPVSESVTIRLAAGRYAEPAGIEFNRRMQSNGKVNIVGGDGVVLDWPANGPMITVADGRWALEGVQIGTRAGGQREGIRVTGPGVLELRDARIRTGSQSAPGLRAEHGGRALLAGRIEINEDLHDDRGRGDTFAGIQAFHGGVVKFVQRDGASLSIGNGSLSAGYYGTIELGCAWARVTSWGDQSNCLAINNSGRIDLHNTSTTLCAREPRNTPIGLEHDGHVLAEGARIAILGCNNHNAIVLQKASTFFCNDVAIRGPVRQGLLASSGSVLLAGIDGDLPGARATTGATVIVEKLTGRMTGAVEADKGGRVEMPDGNVIGGDAGGGAAGGTSGQKGGESGLPPLHKAAAGGHQATVQKLLAEGADVHERDTHGRTALHWAAFAGHTSLAELLIKAGANPQARDADNKTAAQLAAEMGHDGTARASK